MKGKKKTEQVPRARRAARAPLQSEIICHNPECSFRAKIKNISKSGALFILNHNLQENQELDITISFPNENQYQLKGIVSRILGQPPDQLIGVRFKFDDDSSTLQFEKDIENLMVQNLGDIMFEKLFPQS